MGKKEHKRKRASESASKGNSPDGKRVLAFGALAFVVLGAVAYFLWPVLKPSGPMAPNAIAVQVSMGGFYPKKIEARVGQPVTIRLINKDNQFHTDGGGWHQFAIDRLAVDVKIPPLKTQEFTFIPQKAGSFDFYCGVCCGGRANPYMHGTLVVRN